MVRAAINGFGRIGRTAFRAWLNRVDLHDQLDIVVINTSGSMDLTGWGNSLKYDSAYRKLPQELSLEVVHGRKEVNDEDPLLGFFHVSGRKIPVLAQKDPSKIPWLKYEVDIVLECTGVFRDEKTAGLHLQAGAKRVLISAPGKGGPVGTFVLGVNGYDGSFPIADNASCTTNCIAPVTSVIHSTLGIKKAAMTTIHAFTDDQNLQDGSHKEDLRRARAASMNMVPTSTGAAKAVTAVITDLKGKFDGIAIRVPVITGSISDLTFVVNRATSKDEVNQIIKDASTTPRWRGLIAWTDEPIVSSDVIGRSESVIVDTSLTQVIDGDLVKIFAWYDNEWGYSNRLIEQAIAVART
jgi:glyceraldehyde-3-phosphate dehydrogenase (NAD(P))